jgi:secreted trypsin-like serine protease
VLKSKCTISTRKRTRLIAAATVGAATMAFGAATSAQAVVGGKPAHTAKNSFLVVIKWDGPDSFCAGTAISHTQVLTSAQCILNNEASAPQVIAGRDNVYDTKHGTAIKAKGVWIPDSYTDYGRSNGKVNTPVDDIAVLLLAKPLPSSYHPLKWVPSGFVYKAGAKARILGFGTTSQNQKKTDGNLREATVSVLPGAACTAPYATDYKSGSMVCAGKPAGGVGTCNKDGGAPLLISDGREERVAGIISWGGRGCAEAGNPDVFAKVSKFSKTLAELPTK